MPYAVQVRRHVNLRNDGFGSFVSNWSQAQELSQAAPRSAYRRAVVASHGDDEDQYEQLELPRGIAAETARSALKEPLR
eukprot:scaffold480_cov257-Pinguiococcus_pyrenoidosus.AAC.23